MTTTVLTFKIWLTFLVCTLCCIPLDEYRGRHRRKIQIFLTGLILADIAIFFTLILMGIWL